MKDLIKILGIIATAATVLTALFYRKKSKASKRPVWVDFSSLNGTGKGINDKKSTLYSDVYGPANEEVHTGLYDGPFYEDSNGHRVYLHNY